MPLCLWCVCACVCACASACVRISVLGLCPAKVHVPVCVRTRCDDFASVCEWRSVCFYNTVECVVHFQRTNSGIQFDRCENLSKKCIYRRWGKKKRLYCCCKTIIHVDILSYNQPIVSLYLRYSQGSSGWLALRCTYHRPVINAVVGS